GGRWRGWGWTDSHWPPYLAPGSFAERLFQRRSRALASLGWIWPAAVAAALVVGSAIDLRLAIFAAVLLLYFGGYPAIQFHERHMFHLDIVAPLALAFLAGRAAQLVRWGRQGANDRRLVAARCARAGVCAVALPVLVVAPLVPLRAYQRSELRTTLAARLAAPKEPVGFTSRRVDDRRVIYEPAMLPAQRAAESAPGTVTSEYLLARIGGDRCDALRLSMTLRYDAPFPRGDLSETELIEMMTSDGPAG